MFVGFAALNPTYEGCGDGRGVVGKRFVARRLGRGTKPNKRDRIVGNRCDRLVGMDLCVSAALGLWFGII